MKMSFPNPVAKPLALAVLALFLAACSEPPPPPAPPKLVRTLEVGAGETANLRTYSGEVHARIETSLGFRTGGKLVERLVDAGSSIKAGQILARLDPTDAGLQAAAATAQRSLAAAELKRYRDLKERNFISASALDAKETAFKAADAQAGLAKNQAGYTTLQADRSGLIAQVLAEPGQVVSAGQPVFRVAQDGEREISISLPESELGNFAVGRRAEVTLWSAAPDEQKVLLGRLREISPAADPVTRTYPARVSIKDVDPRLPLGMSATVRFPASTEGAEKLMIPLSAIFQKGNQPAVWKVGADGTATLHPVTVAAYTDQGALLSEGVSKGEQIVAAGVSLLTEGEKVRVVGSAK